MNPTISTNLSIPKTFVTNGSIIILNPLNIKAFIIIAKTNKIPLLKDKVKQNEAIAKQNDNI